MIKTVDRSTFNAPSDLVAFPWENKAPSFVPMSAEELAAFDARATIALENYRKKKNGNS